MKVYIDQFGNIVKVLDNVFVANSTTYDNTMTWFFVDAEGEVVQNTEVSFCQISLKRSDGHIISRLNAPLTNTDEGYGYKYTCTGYDGVLMVAGALEITAQFVKATIEGGVITERETLCTTVVEGHVKLNYGIAGEEYFNDVLEQAMLDRDTLQAEITALQGDVEDCATSQSVSDALENYALKSSLSDVATSGAYADLTGKPTIPTVNNATLNIKKNGTSVGTFTANASSDVDVNITVPTQASDVDALPDTTKYAKSFDLSINNSTYVMTFKLKDQDGTALKTETIDLPLETMVVDGEYDADTKKVILTLQNGNTVSFSIADLISGLQPTITAGTGLSKSGATLNHSNSVTAATKGSATAIPQITYDAQGHITGVTEKTVYPPTTSGTSGQYWKADGSGVGTWTTPSSSPSSGSNTLISSGAVYSALANYLTTTSASSSYQTKITSSNKVSADNVDDTGTTNKFVTASEKAQITTNANAIGDSQTSGTIIYRLDAIESDIATASAILDNL